MLPPLRNILVSPLRNFSRDIFGINRLIHIGIRLNNVEILQNIMIFHCIRYNWIWRFHDTYLIFFVKRNYFLVLSKSLSPYLYGLETFLQSIWRNVKWWRWISLKKKQNQQIIASVHVPTIRWSGIIIIAIIPFHVILMA